MPKSRGKWGWVNNIYNIVNNEIMAINKFKALRKVINVFKAIMEFKARDFYGSNALWNYVVVNVLLKSYIIHHDQSGFSRPNHKGKRGRR